MPNVWVLYRKKKEERRSHFNQDISSKKSYHSNWKPWRFNLFWPCSVLPLLLLIRHHRHHFHRATEWNPSGSHIASPVGTGRNFLQTHDSPLVNYISLVRHNSRTFNFFYHISPGQTGCAPHPKSQQCQKAGGTDILVILDRMSHPNQIPTCAMRPNKKPPCWQIQEQNSLFSQLVFISDATVMIALGTSSGTSAVTCCCH